MDDPTQGASAFQQDDCEPPEPPPPPPAPVAGVVSPPPAATDVELEAALANVGFLEAWFVLTPTDPRLSLLPATSPEADAARQAVLDQAREIVDTREAITVLLNVTQDAVARKRGVERKLTAVDDQIAALRVQWRLADERLAGLEAALERVLRGLQESAVGLYVSDQQVGVAGVDDVGKYNASKELAERVDATIEELLRQRADLEARVATQQQRIAELDETISTRMAERTVLEAEHLGLVDTIETLTSDIAELTGHRVDLEEGFPSVILAAHTARMTAIEPTMDVSIVTLDSYVRAADGIVERYPSCAVRWQLLAGIATVESDQGRIGGAHVGPDGAVSRRILGPILDGTLEDTAVIRDTDGGRMDGNAEYDAAVGPFQFIPGTWAGFGLDGDGDGLADPHNMYDGAMSAAGYLCSQSTLGTDPEVARSVLAYNHSGKYLYDVTTFARSYILRFGLPEPAFDPDELAVDDALVSPFAARADDIFEEIGQIGATGAAGPDAGEPSELDDPSTDEPVFRLDPSLLTNTGD